MMQLFYFVTHNTHPRIKFKTTPFLSLLRSLSSLCIGIDNYTCMYIYNNLTSITTPRSFRKNYQALVSQPDVANNETTLVVCYLKYCSGSDFIDSVRSLAQLLTVRYIWET